MAKHSVAQAKTQLSALIDCALRGEEVVITRHGHPVAELRPVARRTRAMTKEDVDWLIQRRIHWNRPDIDSSELVSRMRDEDWDR